MDETFNAVGGARQVIEDRTELGVLRAENEQFRQAYAGQLCLSGKVLVRVHKLEKTVQELTAQLYATQCRDCAGQGMPTVAPRFCARCGERMARVVGE